ncbi:MAG TPA: hypothetical protein VI233_13870 [Puia sp.]
MKKLTVQIVIHIAAWMCFLTLPFAFYPRPQNESFDFSRYLSTYFIINNLFIIAF